MYMCIYLYMCAWVDECEWVDEWMGEWVLASFFWRASKKEVEEEVEEKEKKRKKKAVLSRSSSLSLSLSLSSRPSYPILSYLILYIPVLSCAVLCYRIVCKPDYLMLCFVGPRHRTGRLYVCMYKYVCGVYEKIGF